jgi:hypothetical protein
VEKEMTEQQKLNPELEKSATTLIETLKKNYKESATPRAIDDAARHAFNVWKKAALGNPRTGAAQIDESSGVSSMERYFTSKLPIR